MRPDMPIMFMTGFPDQRDMLRGETVLEKPFSEDRLVRLVAESSHAHLSQEDGALANIAIQMIVVVWGLWTRYR
jgi:FixJ family two-component response regulator